MLTACGGGGEPPAAEGPDEQATADGTTLSAQWPLTGEPVEGELPDRPVLVVKIDNTSSASPQVGLGKADLVVEELVEGGSTRLAVFFHSQLPRTVGPVRSMRATDIGIVQPAEAVLVASGGAGPTVRRMAAAGVQTVTEGATGYYRDGARRSPYNLFMNLPELARTLEADGVPEAYFRWGSEVDLPSGRRAGQVAAQFSGGHTTTWRYDGRRYAEVDGHAADGDEFRPDTLVVLRVKVGDAGYRDPAGNPVPETRLAGRGRALVLHDGRLVRATWSKDGLAAPLELSTPEGDLALSPGRVWVGLVPAADGDVRVTR